MRCTSFENRQFHRFSPEHNAGVLVGANTKCCVQLPTPFTLHPHPMQSRTVALPNIYTSAGRDRTQRHRMGGEYANVIDITF